MSGRRKATTGAGSPRRKSRAAEGENDSGPPRSAAQPDRPPRNVEACRLAALGKYEEARRVYARLNRGAARKDALLRGLIQNDLAVLDALDGKFDEAREGWRRAIEADGGLLLARLNRDLMEAEISLAGVQEEAGELELVPAPGSSQLPVAGWRMGPCWPCPLQRSSRLRSRGWELQGASRPVTAVGRGRELFRLWGRGDITRSVMTTSVRRGSQTPPSA